MSQNITILENFKNQSSKIIIRSIKSNSKLSKEVDSGTKMVQLKNKTSEKNTSSITILTSASSGCHISINNHFNEVTPQTARPAKTSTEDTEHAQPNFALKSDVTNIIEKSINNDDEFTLDEDVLVENGDGKLYLGTIKTTCKGGQYLVKFDDNTEKWSAIKNIKKLNNSLDESGEDSPMCVVCKIKKENDVVEVCDKCARGYHRHCIVEELVQSNSPWCCARCAVTDVISISDSDDEEIEIEKSSFKNITQLSYDIKLLHWDMKHRVNMEQIYCYCGRSGSWFSKMLQCTRCNQWFHGNCLTTPNCTLLYGDSFYIFVCLLCNDGEEFLRRLVLSWVDLIHLLLFDITKILTHKYHNIYEDFPKYILNNWDTLQLPSNMEKFRSITELKTIIQQTVINNPHRFKSGSEVKKQKNLFCLRKNLPPMMNPKINVPTDVPVTEDLLQSIGIKFISLTKQKEQQDVNKCQVENVKTQSDQSPDIVSKVIINENIPDVIRERKQSRKNKGVVVNASIEKQRKIDFEMSSNKRVSITSDQDMTGNNIEESTIDLCELSDDVSKSTLDWIIPTPKNFRGLNNPFHSQYKPDVVMAKGAKNSKNAKRNGNFVRKNIDKNKQLRAAEGLRIVRTIKRRLSAKDLLQGKNQEVKRRKIRHSSVDMQVISTTIQPSSLKLPLHLPFRNDYKEWNNSMSNRQGTSTPLSSASSISSLSAASASTSTITSDVCNQLKRTDSVDKKVPTVRLLRQRRSQNYSEKPKRNSAGTDDIETIETSSINKTRNMSLYFASLNRIENGEQFFILAKRTTNDGSKQFLLEWKNLAITTIEDFNIPSSEKL